MPVSKKELDLLHCAKMILHDECPPDNTAYLCQMAEDADEIYCCQCWDNYLWRLMHG